MLARYILVAAGVEATTWNVRGLAVGSYTVIIMSESGVPYFMTTLVN